MPDFENLLGSIISPLHRRNYVQIKNVRVSVRLKVVLDILIKYYY